MRDFREALILHPLIGLVLWLWLTGGAGAAGTRQAEAVAEAEASPWIRQPGGAALGVWDGGRLHGYGVIRPCRQGYKIGPLFADNSAIAERLFLALTRTLDEGEAFFLDIPEANPEALALVNRHEMEVVFETARMYTGAFPQLPMDRIFGVTSFELG